MSEEELVEDEKKVIDVLDRAHARGKVCLTRPEIEKNTKLSRARVKAALASLNAKKIIGSEDHTVTTLYYLKRYIKIARKES